MTDRSTVEMRIAAFVFGIVLAVAALPPSGCAQVQSDSTYSVQPNDTLFSIARRFGVSVQSLRSWNNLEGTALQVGQTLRIRPPQPTTPPTARRDSAADGSTPPPPYGRHTAEQGDTFVSLALRLGTTADTLFALNDRSVPPLERGSTLRLPRRFGPPTHLVQKGETLYSIAGEYGVSVRSLQATNDLDTTAIAPSQRLRLPTQTAPTVPPVGTWANPDSTGTVAVYPTPFAGRLTTSGEPYDPEAFVVSHPFLPYGSMVLLSRPETEQHSFARVIDRGPPGENAFLDISAAVAEQLGIDADARPTVALRTVWIQGRLE